MTFVKFVNLTGSQNTVAQGFGPGCAKTGSPCFWTPPGSVARGGPTKSPGFQGLGHWEPKSSQNRVARERSMAGWFPFAARGGSSVYPPLDQSPTSTHKTASSSPARPDETAELPACLQACLPCLSPPAPPPPRPRTMRGTWWAHPGPPTQGLQQTWFFLRF